MSTFPKKSTSRDPGFGQKHEARMKRLINSDGSFNVVRRGAVFSFADTYIYLIRMSWPRFIGLVATVYFAINCLFALIYLWIGADQISGASTGDPWRDFFNVFFFSTQTFTTVGYGAMAPSSMATGMVAAVEAMTGLLSFALATGLLYGRFSKPNARILFSERAIVAPTKEGHSLQFRMVNQRPNVLMEMRAQVLISMLDRSVGEHYRQYYQLPLENDFIQFFPLNWTLVHRIDANSPLHGMDEHALQLAEVEVMILLSGFDDAFSQTVRKRFSYRADEIIWNARFGKAFHIDESGTVIMDVEKIHHFESVSPDDGK